MQLLEKAFSITRPLYIQGFTASKPKKCSSWFPACCYGHNYQDPSPESARTLKYTRSSKRLWVLAYVCVRVCVCGCVHAHSVLYFFILLLLHCPKYRIEIDSVFWDQDQILTSRNQISFRQCLGSEEMFEILWELTMWQRHKVNQGCWKMAPIDI